MNKHHTTLRYLTKKQRLMVIPKKNGKYRNMIVNPIAELITSRWYEWLDKWIISKRNFMGGDILSLRQYDGNIYFGLDFDKPFRSYYTIKDVTLLKMLSSIRTIMEQSPKAINVCYYNDEFCFEINNNSDYFESYLMRNNNRYDTSNEYETLLSKLLSTLSSQVIKNLKKKITSHGLPCIDQKEFFVTIKDNYVVLSYKCKKLVQFSYELKCDVFFKMLDDWQQILEDKPSKVDVYYDGKSVWFETK